MSHWDDFRLEFDDDGTLNLRGRQNRQTPTCPICGQEIRWVLDMFSFLTLNNGAYQLAHARCAWTPEAFERELDLARETQQPTNQENQ